MEDYKSKQEEQEYFSELDKVLKNFNFRLKYTDYFDFELIQIDEDSESDSDYYEDEILILNDDI